MQACLTCGYLYAFITCNTVALAAAAAAADNDDDNDGRWSPWFRPSLNASRPATIAAFRLEVSAN